MKTFTSLLCSVGLHRVRPAGHLGLGYSPVHACTRCPSKHVVYWGGALIDVTPIEQRDAVPSARRAFKLLRSIAVGRLDALLRCINRTRS